MRIRINLLSLLRTLVRVAGQVATIGELVLAAHGSRTSDGGEPLDLDAVRRQPTEPATGTSSGSSSEPGSWPSDPSAAH